MLNAVGVLIPVFLLFAFMEWLISKRLGKDFYSSHNTLMNISIGAMDQLLSLGVFVLFYSFLAFIYNHYRLLTLENNWKQWILAYICIDFVSYWYHRLSHRINVLWAGHITHHSSDHFNFSNGFRTSPFQGLNRIPFWALLPLFGFSPMVLIVTFKISGIYDFFLHTRHIPKLGFLEKILITPSMHRVHHGKNNIYIDKNYGSTFVIWDKLFGTYQEETEPVRYGITQTDYVDDHPVNAIFFHYRHLWKKMNTLNGWSKLQVLIMPPEWGQDITKQMPVANQKYAPGNGIKRYTAFQLLSSSLGFILALSFQNYLTSWEFLFYAFSSVAGLVNCTLIFTRNLKPVFKNFEIARLLINFLCLVLIFIITHHAYVPLLISYTVVSGLVLIAKSSLHWKIAATSGTFPSNR